MLGEMANDLLLTSCRAVPEKLIDASFRFNHETLEQALRFELGRKNN
jgi:NAD dependent epimerase/dehydratase family enzyme